MREANSTVLACIDGSDLSGAVAQYAAWIAASIDKPLLLLNTVEHHKKEAKTDMTGHIGLGTRDELLETLSSEDHEEGRAQMAKGKEALMQAKAHAQAHTLEPEILQRHGELYENLLELEPAIRVLLIGQRGEDSHGDLKIGAQVQAIIRSLHKPILLVNGPFKKPQKVMLAYDGTPSAQKALQMIAQSPLFKTLVCEVVYVYKDESAAEKMLESARKVLEGSGVAYSCTAISGEPVAALLAYRQANGIDLTVMGAFSHNRLRDAIFGSFTAKMIAQSDKPLLLLR